MCTAPTRFALGATKLAPLTVGDLPPIFTAVVGNGTAIEWRGARKRVDTSEQVNVPHVGGCASRQATKRVLGARAQQGGCRGQMAQQQRTLFKGGALALDVGTERIDRSADRAEC